MELLDELCNENALGTLKTFLHLSRVAIFGSDVTVETISPYLCPQHLPES